MANAKKEETNQVKLGTFAGVFIPTSLNIFSILSFLRFGFILGQVGVFGFLGMLLICYIVDLLTFSSISAIATNGTVKGGGAYYLISRSLGPEFGGAIGVIFYLGMTFNCGMNAVGLISALTYNIGLTSGKWINWLPDTFWWSYLWATCVLLVVTAICLAGSALFAKAGNALFVVILIAIYSIPLSAFVVKPFESPSHGVKSTGPSLDTLKSNLYPHFTAGADGSILPGKENWQDVFGILFPATAGIFAGASMSGDLKSPAKSIPTGTLGGLHLGLGTYCIMILSLASTITRQSLYNNANIVQDTNFSGTIIVVGELSVTFFGALLSLMGCAKILQAIARDNLLPGLKVFGYGSPGSDEPRYAILLTYAIAQLSMLFDINQLAGLVGMAILLTFLVTNLACFLLEIGSAPNFRPSFRYFGWQTAALGTILSCAIMIYVDGTNATASFIVAAALFLVIHYSSPPKAWGDVSQSLIYHQVRKYLLRLRQDHVKSWRPSVLLLINDPRRSFKLVQFCNSLKKGALFILGHVIVTDDFKGAAPEAKKQLSSWNKYIKLSNIKAFTNITVGPKVKWGIRNLVLSSGLGGMRPNIVILGFFNLEDLRKKQPLIQIPSPQPSRPVSRRNSNTRIASMWSKIKKSTLPTDANRPEGDIDPQSYVTVLEDLLHGVRINVAIAKGFERLQLPAPSPGSSQKFKEWFKPFGASANNTPVKYIDLWPIQMSSFTQIEGTEGREKRSVLTTNFDTYTLILQLGAILETVDAWQLAYKLRVSVFVEYETDVEEEKRRVHSLLSSLRIKADVRVFWLAQGDLKTYEVIVNGRRDEDYQSNMSVIDEVLHDEAWWRETQQARHGDVPNADLRQLVDFGSASLGTPSWAKTPLKTPAEPSEISVARLRKVLKNMKQGVGHLEKYHPALRVRLSNIDQQLIDHYQAWGSDSENESSDSEDEDDASSKRASSSTQERRRDIESVLSHPRRQATFTRAESPSSLSKPIAIHPSAGASDTALMEAQQHLTTSRSPSRAPTPVFGTPLSTASGSYRRPFAMRQSSLPKFTSKPVPATKISTDPDGGPSIMFDEPATESSLSQQIAEASRSSTPTLSFNEATQHRTASPGIASGTGNDIAIEEPEQATGFPFQSSVPLSFNDLPSRAQNLILNELMVHNSSDAGVVFTTLPSPAEGTSDSEEDSVQYLSDLEVLCQGLPPVLLVHCNTVTVTVSL